MFFGGLFHREDYYPRAVFAARITALNQEIWGF